VSSSASSLGCEDFTDDELRVMLEERVSPDA
jgi:hypothetical protein